MLPDFSAMSQQALLDYIRLQCQQKGVGAISYPALKRQKGLYFALYNKGISQKHLTARLGMKEEYADFKARTFKRVMKDGTVRHRWSWDRVIKEVTPVVKSKGFLPPGQWFQANGMGSLVGSLYNLGKNWAELRDHFKSYKGSTFVQSRNGMRWRSHAEASLSNFLYARCIEHKRGEKYPAEYAAYGQAAYGYFDLHFRARDGRWIDVEIWGDKPKGHNEAGYKKKRIAKERFNKTNKRFLGLHYTDCYEDAHLITKLAPYIGRISPFVFDKPADKILQPTHWSNADELLDYCQQIAKEQPGGVFPTEGWLRKRGKWKTRKGPSYNTVSIYIKTWIGGIRQLRELLNQGRNSTTAWTKEKALAAYKAFFEKHGITPGQASTDSRDVDQDTLKEANNISAAIAKYVGSTRRVNKLAGILPERKKKWSEELLKQEVARLFAKYSLSMSQIARLRTADRRCFGVSREDANKARRVCGIIRDYVADPRALYESLGIKNVDIRTLKKYKRHLQHPIGGDPTA